MAADSRNPGEDSTEAGMETVSFRMPRWLKDEIKGVADRRLSDSSAMFREALLEWLTRQKASAS